MKQNIYIGMLVCGLLLAACEQTYDGVFDLSPDERTAAKLDEYRKVLTGSENGWLLHYYSDPTKLGAISFVLKFSDDGKMKLNWSVRDDEQEAAYSLKMFEKPMLVFDSYCNLSKLADPDIQMGGENEFAFLGVSAGGDTVYMEERVKKDPVILVKAAPTAWEDIKKYPGQNLLLQRVEEKVVPFYYNLNVEGWNTAVTMVYYENREVVYLFYNEDGKPRYRWMGINFTHDGFEFHEPFGWNGHLVRSFRYDEVTNSHTVADAGVHGAFTYQNSCAAEIPGMAERYFGAKKFGENSKYCSPKMLAAFSGLSFRAGFMGISYNSYGGMFSDLKILFEDWSAIQAKAPEFRLKGENVVAFGMGGYSSTDYSEEEMEQMLASEAGQQLRKLLEGEKGWTIVPFYLENEYAKSFWLVSNEDPEMYFSFGGDVD